MSEFYSQVHQELLSGRDVCLATIVRQQGSAPRSLGTHFFVRADGTFEGTIGGGPLEAEVIAAAQVALAEGRSQVVPYRMTGKEIAECQMICGGDLDVFLEPLLAADQGALDLYQGAARAAAKGGPALLATVLADGPIGAAAERKVLVAPQREALGNAELARALDQELPQLQRKGGAATPWLRPALGETPPLFVEPIVTQPTLYLFGGGHVSQHVGALAKLVDFRLVVIDDRREFANQDRFPQADELWVRHFENVLEGADLGPMAYVVIITRGHVFDKDVLAQALRRPTAYLGMIGSRRKKALIYKALEAEGVSKQDLARVHSPIGLDIGAETPQEIAVSIVAELVAVRAGVMP